MKKLVSDRVKSFQRQAMEEIKKKFMKGEAKKEKEPTVEPKKYGKKSYGS